MTNNNNKEAESSTAARGAAASGGSNCGVADSENETDKMKSSSSLQLQRIDDSKMKEEEPKEKQKNQVNEEITRAFVNNKKSTVNNEKIIASSRTTPPSNNVDVGDDDTKLSPKKDVGGSSSTEKEMKKVETKNSASSTKSKDVLSHNSVALGDNNGDDTKAAAVEATKYSVNQASTSTEIISSQEKNKIGNQKNSAGDNNQSQQQVEGVDNNPKGAKPDTPAPQAFSPVTTTSKKPLIAAKVDDSVQQPTQEGGARKKLDIVDPSPHASMKALSPSPPATDKPSPQGLSVGSSNDGGTTSKKPLLPDTKNDDLSTEEPPKISNNIAAVPTPDEQKKDGKEGSLATSKADKKVGKSKGTSVPSSGQKNDKTSSKEEPKESAAVYDPPAKTDETKPPPPVRAVVESGPAGETKLTPISNKKIAPSINEAEGQKVSNSDLKAGTQIDSKMAAMQPVESVKQAANPVPKKHKEQVNRNISMAMNLPLSSKAGDIKGITVRPSGKWQCQLYCAGASRYVGVFESETMAVMAYRVVRARIKAVSGDNSDITKNRQMSLLESLRKRYNPQSNKDIDAEAILQKDYKQYVIENPSIIEPLPAKKDPPSITANNNNHKIKRKQQQQQPAKKLGGENAVMEQSSNSSKATSNNNKNSNKSTNGNSKSASSNKAASKTNVQNDHMKKKRKSSVGDANRGNNKNNPPIKKQKAEAKLWDSIRPGDRIAIFWPDDDQYYDATVQKQRSKESSEFFILYDDEETEWLDLNKEKFHFLRPPSPTVEGESNNQKSTSGKTTNTAKQPSKAKDPSVVPFCQHYATSRSPYNSTDENLWTLLHAGDRISIFSEDKKAYIPALVAKQRGKNSPIFFLVYNYDDHFDKEQCGGAEYCSWTDMRFEDYTITRQHSSYQQNDYIPSKIRFQFNFSEKVYQLLVDFELEDPNIGHWSNGGKAFVMDESHPKIGEYLSRYFRHSSFSSFRRQLNTYGFTRKRFGDLAGNYMHSAFSKENTLAEVANMNRSKKKTATSETSVSPTAEDSLRTTSGWTGAIGITVGRAGMRLIDGSSVGSLDVEPYDLEQQERLMSEQKKKDKRSRRRREKELSSVPVGYDLGAEYLPPIMQALPFQLQNFFHHDDSCGGDDEGDETIHSSLASYENQDNNDENIEMLPDETEEDYRNRRQKIYDARSIERKKQRRANKRRKESNPPPPPPPGSTNEETTLPHCVHYLPPIIQPSLLY